MANLGDLVIKVGGNVDGFKASMQDASASAEQFTSGIATQLSQSGTLFDQFGRTISSTGAPLEALTKQHSQLTKEVGNVSRAAEGMGFNFRYAFFGIKDIMEGRTKFAIAELANELVSMGTKALTVGLAIGAIGTAAYFLGRSLGLWGEISEAEKKANEQAKKYDEQILKINDHIAETARKIELLKFGALAAAGLEAPALATKILQGKLQERVFQDEIDKERQRLSDNAQAARLGGAEAGTAAPIDASLTSPKLKELQHQLRVIQTQIFSDEQDSQQKMRELMQKELDDTQEKVNKQIEAEKDATAKLKSADDDKLATLKASHQVSVGEVIRYWQERLAAESTNAQRVHEIGITLGTLYQENDKIFERVAEHGRKVGEEQIKKAQEWKSKLEVLVQEAEQISEKIAADDVEKRKKLTDIGAKATASGEEGAASFKKLEAERQFGLLLNQNGQARIALEQKIEAADAAISQAKIEAIRKEQEAETDAVKKAELGLEMQNAIIAGAERQFQVETKIAQLKQKESLGFRLSEDVVHAGKEVPGALGNSLAKGLFDGKNIGRDIAQSLKGIGQQMMGNVFTKLISTTLAHIAATIGLTAATTTNAGVTTIHAGTMLTHAGVMITHGLTVVGNTIAVIANTLWVSILAAVEAVKAFFGFADGGVPPLGVPSIVGERGPELFIPHQLGTIIPNHEMKAFASNGGGVAGRISSSTSTLNSGGNTFHFHGVQDTRGMMRAIASVAKTASPKFSPFAT